MLKNNKSFVASVATSALLATGLVHAQTIQELTDAARAKKHMEFQKVSAAAAALPNPAENNQAIGKISEPKPRKIQALHSLVSIYGVGSNLVAEIAEGERVDRYKPGDQLSNSWKIESIQTRSVKLVKTSRNGKVTESKVLSFWIPLEDAKPVVRAMPAAFPQSGTIGYNQPPIPVQQFGGK